MAKCRRGFRPGGTVDNSPAIHRWGRGGEKMFPDPEGRSRIAQRFIAGDEGRKRCFPSRRDDRNLTVSYDFDRPSGTENISYMVHLPSSKLLGYYRTPLRGKSSSNRSRGSEPCSRHTACAVRRIEGMSRKTPKTAHGVCLLLCGP